MNLSNLWSSFVNTVNPDNYVSYQLIKELAIQLWAGILNKLTTAIMRMQVFYSWKQVGTYFTLIQSYPLRSDLLKELFFQITNV